MPFLDPNVDQFAPANDPNATSSNRLRSKSKFDSSPPKLNIDMYGIGTLFDGLRSYPCKLMLDNPVAMDDAFQALSRTTEGDVSSPAQSPRRNERRRRGDKDAGPPEILDDQISRLSNHWQSTLVEMNAGTSLQGAVNPVDSTWSTTRSSDETPGMEHSMTRAGAGVMFQQWLNVPPRDDPYCCWTR